MMPDEDRLRLRHTFNEAAGSYHQVRPDYPAELFDELVAVARLAPGDHLLELGCGPGKATVPLAQRGFRITCVEPGPKLAAAARRNLASLDAEVIEGRFEEWQPRAGERFDLVYAATAWHWIDPAVRYRRAWQVLRPGGHLAFWSALHVFPDDGDPFFREIQEVYEEIGEGLPPGEGFPRPGELREQGAEIGAGGLFEVSAIEHFDGHGAQIRAEVPDALATALSRAGKRAILGMILRPAEYGPGPGRSRLWRASWWGSTVRITLTAPWTGR